MNTWDKWAAVIAVVMVFVYLGSFALIAYVIIHFVLKFW